VGRALGGRRLAGSAAPVPRTRHTGGRRGVALPIKLGGD
jgi:hypothetical protein